ncbi:hypothetical protein ABVN80_18305 [Acinetobacter baumannii]
MHIKGDYVKEIAQGIIDKDSDAYVREVANVYKDVPEDVQYAEELDSQQGKQKSYYLATKKNTLTVLLPIHNNY